MKRRKFLSAMAGGMLAVACTTRLAQEAWKIGFKAFREGDDIAAAVNSALRRSLLTGDTVVVPDGSYGISDAIVVPTGARLEFGNLRLKSVGDTTRGFIRIAKGGRVDGGLLYREPELISWEDEPFWEDE